MKPPFSYYGGKQRMAPKIVPLLPPHTVYVEPFCGSAAVMFTKGIPEAANRLYREVLNDTNHLITGFFRVMQNKVLADELIYRLQWTVYSHEEFRLAKSLCKSPTQNAVEMAWAWFICVSWSFAGDAGKGLKFSVGNRANDPSVHRNSVERLTLIRDRLSDCYVMSEPALDCIRRWDSKDTCFYVDPPYPGSYQGCYSGFSQADFEQLVEALRACSGSVILSCYENTAVPEDWKKHEFPTIAHSAPSSSRAEAKRTECVWVKPAIGEAHPELKAAMERRAAQRQQLSLFSEVS